MRFCWPASISWEVIIITQAVLSTGSNVLTWTLSKLWAAPEPCDQAFHAEGRAGRVWSVRSRYSGGGQCASKVPVKFSCSMMELLNFYLLIEKIMYWEFVKTYSRQVLYYELCPLSCLWFKDGPRRRYSQMMLFLLCLRPPLCSNLLYVCCCVWAARCLFFQIWGHASLEEKVCSLC